MINFGNNQEAISGRVFDYLKVSSGIRCLPFHRDGVRLIPVSVESLCSALIVISLLGFCEPVDAQSKSQNSNSAKAPQWAQEPRTFLGVTLDSNLDDQLPVCPGGEFQAYKFGAPCHIRLNKKIAAMYNPPDIGMRIKTTTLTTSAEGMVRQITVVIEKFNSVKMLDLLSERYGAVHTSTQIQVTTGGGAVLNGLKYAWTGRNVSIVFSEYGSRSDESRVVVTTGAGAEIFEKDIKDNTQKFKGNL
jgi:hypothetical protein